MPSGTWIYNLSAQDEYGVLTAKYYSITESYIQRFIRDWIDRKYSITDHLLLSLNGYLNQLIEDQEEVLEMINSNEDI